MGIFMGGFSTNGEVKFYFLFFVCFIGWVGMIMMVFYWERGLGGNGDGLVGGLGV